MKEAPKRPSIVYTDGTPNMKAWQKTVSSDCFKPPVKHWEKLSYAASLFQPKTLNKNDPNLISAMLQRLPKDEEYNNICEKVMGTVQTV